MEILFIHTMMQIVNTCAEKPNNSCFSLLQLPTVPLTEVTKVYYIGALGDVVSAGNGKYYHICFC